MNTPRFITHYYLPESGPLRSLSDLQLETDNPIFESFLTRHKREPTYRRRFGREYLRNRRVIEDRLRDLFIARGGRPKRKHPFYFILGDSPWFKGLNHGHLELRIDISHLSAETTSITYPDSFIALTQTKRPYHNQVFLLNEIDDLINRHGMPSNDQLVPYERYWETDFELYIEVQLWDDPENILRMKTQARNDVEVDHENKNKC